MRSVHTKQNLFLNKAFNQKFYKCLVSAIFFLLDIIMQTPLEGSHKGRDIPSRVIDDTNAWFG